MIYGLSEHTIQKLVDVFKRNNLIDAAILFGSRAKGTFREGSDIDIALKGEKLNVQMLKKIELQVDELMLPYEVNIIIYQTITNQQLIEHIKRAGITIYYKKQSKVGNSR